MPQPLQLEVADTTEPSVSRPKMVDDLYWLERGRTILDESAASADSAAQRLVTAVGWFWTAYTGTTIIGLSIIDRNLSTADKRLVALPFIVLLGAYALAHHASMPLSKAFDGRFPDQVRALHNEAIRVRTRRLRLALVATAAGAISVAIAVTAAIATSAEHLSVDIAVRVVDDVPAVILSGRLDDATEATAIVTPQDQASEAVVLELSDSGRYSEVVEVAEAESYEVTVSWETATQAFRVTEIGKLPPGP